MTTLPTLADPAPLQHLPGGLRLSDQARRALDVDPRELVARWLAGKAPGTVRSYRSAAAEFGRWATDGEDLDLPGIFRTLLELPVGTAHLLVRGWRDALLEGGAAPRTVNVRVAAVASIVKLGRQLGLIDWQLSGLAVRAEKRHDRRGPSRDAVADLVAHLEEVDDPEAVRDVAIVRLLHGVGLRRGELVALDLAHVDLDDPDGPAVWVLGKGRKERERVGLPPRATEALRRWLAVRGEDQAPPAPGGSVVVTPEPATASTSAVPPAVSPLFVRLDRARRTDADPLTGEAVRRMLARRAGEVGLRGRLRPHGLRHRGASDVATRGSVAALQAWGRWRSLDSAKHYLDDQAQQQVAAATGAEV